jgi:gluconate kinase
VYLKGGKELIRERLKARTAHFMPAGLLGSQFASLEGPGPDESPVVIDVTPPLEILMGQLPRIVEASLSSAPPRPY